MTLYAVNIQTAQDASGVPISFAKLEFFEAGTSTPLDTFSDSALSVANTNPVIADSSGRFSAIYLQNQDYKVVLSDASDIVIWTQDPVAGVDLSSTTAGISDTATAITLSITDTDNFLDGNFMVGSLAVTPDGRLHVYNGSAGVVMAPAAADELVIEDDADAGLSILTPDTDTGTINFGAPSNASFAQLQALYNSNVPYIAVLVGGTEVARFGGSKNFASVQNSALTSSSTVMATDDTIPQNTEGDEVMVLTYTPKSASSTLVIEVTAFGSGSAGRWSAGLFVDTTVDAIASGAAVGSSNDTAVINFRHHVVAASVTARTYKVRVGPNSGTLSFNGRSGARLHGGVIASSITITEH